MQNIFELGGNVLWILWFSSKVILMANLEMAKISICRCKKHFWYLTFELPLTMLRDLFFTFVNGYFLPFRLPLQKLHSFFLLLFSLHCSHCRHKLNLNISLFIGASTPLNYSANSEGFYWCYDKYIALPLVFLWKHLLQPLEKLWRHFVSLYTLLVLLYKSWQSFKVLCLKKLKYCNNFFIWVY